MTEILVVADFPAIARQHLCKIFTEISEIVSEITVRFPTSRRDCRYLVEISVRSQ